MSSNLPIFPSPLHPLTDRTLAWGVTFSLPLGQSLQTVTVAPCDAAGKLLDAPDLAVADVSFGQLDASTNEWQIKFYPHNGSPQMYLIRYDYFTNALSPGGLPLGDYFIVRLECLAVGNTL